MGDNSSNANFMMRLNLNKKDDKRIWEAIQEHRGYRTQSKYVKDALLEFVERQEIGEELARNMMPPTTEDKKKSGKNDDIDEFLNL